MAELPKISPFPNFTALLPESNPVETREVSSVQHRTVVFPIPSATVVENDPALQDLQEQLSRTTFSESDLKDLAAREIFPSDTQEESLTRNPWVFFREPDVLSTAESVTDYPFSGSHQGNSFLQKVPSIAGLTSNAPAGSEEESTRQPQLWFFVDLKTKKLPGLIPFSRRSQYSLSLDVKETKHVTMRTPSAHQLLIVGPFKEDLRYLIVYIQDTGHYGCLVVSQNETIAEGLTFCQHWLEGLLGGSNPTQIYLLRNDRKLDLSENFSHLRNFEELKLVRVETLTVKFILRISQYSEKVFFVECNDIDLVRDVKTKFMQVYTLEENVNVANNDHDSDILWLTFGEKVLADNELLRALWKLDIDEFSFESLPASTTFHVHFAPADAVLLKVNFKSDVRKYLKSESVILLSPRATVQTLRDKISMVIHKDPYSFKIFFLGKKIEIDTVLEPFLKTQQKTTLVVEQRTRIRLKLELESSILKPGNEEQVHHFLVDMHRYELLKKLKENVCSRLKVPAYCVDLYREEVLLKEHDDLRTSRLRNGDKIRAVTLPQRIRVFVKPASNHWDEIVVDDVSLSTIGHLKAYVLRNGLTQTMGRNDCAPNSDGLGNVTFNVIFKDALLEDSMTLKEAGVKMNSRLVLVRNEKLGYTAFPPGRVPLYFCSERLNYQPAEKNMAMSDGNKFYISSASVSNTTDRQPETPMLFLQRPSSPTGLSPCTEQLRAQFPLPPSRQQGQSLEAAGQRSYICHICKSESMPILPSAACAGNNSSIVRSHSQRFSEREKGFTEICQHIPRHSTPIENKCGISDTNLCGRNESHMAFSPWEGISDTSGDQTSQMSMQNSIMDSSLQLQKPVKKDVKGSEIIPHVTAITRHMSGYCSEDGKPRHAGEQNYYYQESLEEDSSGKVTFKKYFHAAPEVAGKLLNSAVGRSDQSGLPLLGSSAVNRDWQHQDTPYLYVSREIIDLLSKELGRESQKVMNQLVQHHVVVESEQRYPHDVYQRNYDCLTRWCQIKGKYAKAEDLKQVLEENGRKDLVDQVEKLEKKQNESGYETSP